MRTFTSAIIIMTICLGPLSAAADENCDYSLSPLERHLKEINPAQDDLVYNVSKDFDSVSEETKSALCAEMPAKIPNIKYDGDFLFNLSHKIRMDIVFAMVPEQNKKVGNIARVDIELVNGQTIVKEIQFTNFSLKKEPKTNKLVGKTHRGRNVIIECNP